MTSVLAVDLGGTKTALARVDGRALITNERRLPAFRSVDEAVERIAESVEDAAAVGIIVPGIYTPETGMAWCPNLWGMDDVPLAARLAARVRAPVVIDSDRAGYVLGEAWLGAARGLRHVLFASIGTGIGVGILSDGRVIRGAHGIAGATGWFALDPEWKEPYRTAGCWETESAGPGIAARVGLDDGRAVVEAARAGNTAAMTALDRAARYTAMGLANLISAFNPEAIVLGGGLLVGAADLWLDTIRAEVPRWAQPISAARCRIVMTELGERAGLFGAARLALDTL